MDDERRIDPQHKQTRAVLRLVGPMTLGVGLVFVAVGLVSFFRSFGSFEPPRYFWCAFVGIPLTWLGAAMTQFGYLGAASRYVMGEMAPVQKDTFNFVAHGVRPGVEALARAFRKGFTPTAGEPDADQGSRCPQCDAPRDGSARFCGRCGAEFARKVVCASCGQGNPSDHHFCGGCGEPLG